MAAALKQVEEDKANLAELFRQAYGAVTAMVNEALAPSAQLRLLESVRGLLERWERFDERLFRQQVRARCCMYILLRHISLFLHRPCHSHSLCLSSCPSTQGYLGEHTRDFVAALLAMSEDELDDTDRARRARLVNVFRQWGTRF